MIVFINSANHGYTHEEVVRNALDVEVRQLTYDMLLKESSVPRATYVFTDLDRLSPGDLRHAARIYRELRDAGLNVLNDPARFRSRSGLLRALYDAGINRFNAYRVEENVRPQRWPVFVRNEGDHASPVSDLLLNWEQVERAIDQAISDGNALSKLMIVEYAAEPVRAGLYRKLAAYRIGGTSVATPAVHDTVWLVKYGKDGSAPEDLYADDLRIVTDNPYARLLQPVFELAGLEYGRADFGLVGGAIQVYEINSNPNTRFPSVHQSPQRMESQRVFKHNYLRALQALDGAASGAGGN